MTDAAAPDRPAADAAPSPPRSLRLGARPSLQDGAGVPQPLPARDAALLAWLALEGPTPRARLAGLLWPEHGHDAALNLLRQRLFKLKRKLGDGVVEGRDTLALGAGVAHDGAESPVLLADVSPEWGDAYAAWLDERRAQRRAVVRDALVARIERAEEAQDWPAARRDLDALLALEPLSEDAHRRVVRHHYLAGDRAAALLAFDRLEQVLKDEVGTAPSAPTLALLETVMAGGRVAAARDRRVPAALLRPPRLVGREAEWPAVAAALAAGSVVWIQGEAGVGKSRLLEELIALREGAVGVASRPGDAAVPYALLARLLRAVGERRSDGVAIGHGATPEVGAWLPAARAADDDGAPAVSDGASAAARQRAIVRAATAALAQAAVDGLATVALDDLQFADAATLELLPLLTDAQVLPGLAWIVAQRPDDGAASPLAAAQATLLDAHRLMPLQLEPLGAGALEALVSSMALDSVDAPSLARQLHRHTGGNALFALETLRQAWVEGRIDGRVASLPRPVSVGRLIERRLGRLSTGAVRLARCAAVAGQDFSIELATGVLGVPVLDLADAWSELESGQVLRDGAFAHDLVYEAVRASVPSPIARHLHGQIAAYLDARGVDAGRLAAHWLAADRPGPAAAALRRAAEAAQHAGRVLDAADGFGHAARAYEQAGDADGRFDASLERARVLTAFEFGAAATAAVEALPALAVGEGRALQAVAMRLHLAEMHYDAAFVLREAPAVIASARRLGDATVETHVVVMLANALSNQRRAAEAVALLEPHVARLDGSPDASLSLATRFELCLALAFALDYDGRLRDATAAHDRVLALPGLAARADLRWQAVANRGATEAKRGHLAVAAAAIEESLAIARRSGAVPPARAMQTQVTLSRHLRDTGRYAEALALLEEAHAAHADEARPGELASVEHALAPLYQHLGQPERADALLRVERDGLTPGERTMRWLHRADVTRQLGGDGRPAWQQAQRVVGDPNDIYQRLCQLFATWLLPADEGEAQAASLAVWASSRERFGLALAAHARAAACGLAQGAASRALPHVEAAVALAREFQPVLFYGPEAWLVAARVHAALGQADASATAARTGRDWVMRAHDGHVPAAFRLSFLQRNAVNRELVALAAVHPMR